MSYADAAAARLASGRFAPIVIAAVLGLGLAGCETSGGIFGGSSTPAEAAPPPVAAAPPPPPQPVAALARIAIAPIIGAPDAVARQLVQQLTDAVERQRIAVSKGRDEKVDFTVRGYIVAAREKNSTKVSYIWDVQDPTGKRVNRITGEEIVAGATGKDPWSGVTPVVGQNIADKTATTLGSWVPGQKPGGTPVASTPPPPTGVGAPTPVAQRGAPEPDPTLVANRPPPTPVAATTGSVGRGGEVAAIVAPISGAPGDGSTALAGALQRQLRQRGISLADRPTNATYRVEGRIVMGQPRDGKQDISIEWRVRDPAGKSLGTVAQKNKVDQGSLDGTWGENAEAAAAAAAQGIAKLIPQGRAVN